MNRQSELELFDRLKAAESPATCGDEEQLVPVTKYTSESRFVAERERLFRRQAQLVAHCSELPSPGAFLTRDVGEVPVLLVRQHDGHVRAMLNVCTHRGAVVELDAKGAKRRFVCPYHAWTYDGAGALVKARHAEGFPSLRCERTALTPLACFERGGFVFVCPDPATKPAVEAAEGALLDELAGLGCDDGMIFTTRTRVWNANWKLLVDGGLESYHFKVAHHGTVGPFFLDTGSVYELFGRHVRTVLPRATFPELGRDEWRVREHTHLVYHLFPNATVLLQEGHFDLIRMTPLALDRTLVELSTVVPRPPDGGWSEKATRFWERNHEFTVRTLDEDFALAEQIQRGLTSGANTSASPASRVPSARGIGASTGSSSRAHLDGVELDPSRPPSEADARPRDVPRVRGRVI